MAAGGGLKIVFDRTNNRPRGGRGQLGWVIYTISTGLLDCFTLVYYYIYI